MADKDGSKSLKIRVGLWVHRVFVRLGVLRQSHGEKTLQKHDATNQSLGELNWEDQWRIMRTGFLTVTALFVIDSIVGIAVWVLVQPGKATLLVGTLGLLAVNTVIIFWVLNRIQRKYLKQWTTGEFS